MILVVVLTIVVAVIMLGDVQEYRRAREDWQAGEEGRKAEHARRRSYAAKRKTRGGLREEYDRRRLYVAERKAKEAQRHLERVKAQTKKAKAESEEG